MKEENGRKEARKDERRGEDRTGEAYKGKKQQKQKWEKSKRERAKSFCKARWQHQQRLHVSSAVFELSNCRFGHTLPCRVPSRWGRRAMPGSLPPPPSSLLPRPLEITEYRNTGSPYTLSALHTLSLSIPQTLLARLLARRTLDCLCTALLTWCVGTVGHQPYLYYFIDIGLLFSQAFSPWYWIRKMYFKMKYDLVNRTQSRTTWSAVSILVNLVTISDSIAYFSLLGSILPCKISTNLLWFIHIEWADHKKLGSHQKEGRSYQSVTQNAAKKGLVSITTQSRRGRKPDGIKP